MRLITTILFALVLSSLQAQDYAKYHTAIIKAEGEIFLNEEYDKGLSTYITTFNQYDFVFLSDCITALQIALYAENERAYLQIANKATLNGLIPRHLLKITYIKKHPIYLKYKDTVISMYQKNRPHYLARIDTTALKKMYDLYAYDQMEKNGRTNGEKRESTSDYRARYKQQIKKTVDNLKEIIETKGWPSDRLIGVAQKDIMRELKIDVPDLVEYYYKYKNDFNFSKSQVTPNELGFASTFFMPIIVHYYSHYENNLYGYKLYIDQIKQGYAHPKDVASIYDIPYSINVDDSKELKLKEGDMFFGLGLRIQNAVHGEKLFIPNEEINKYRKQLYIPSIESDHAKIRFFIKNKMYLGWGWWGNRS